jgi:hypothetical protein
MAAGFALQGAGLAWFAAILTTTLPYTSIVVPFARSGVGMAMYLGPVANVVLSSVKPEEEEGLLRGRACVHGAIRLGTRR